MNRKRIALLLVAAGLACVIGMMTSSGKADLSGPQRIEAARRHSGAAARELCTKAGLGYPPRRLFFRGFKESGELEVWAADDDGPMRLLKTFPILAHSGNPGPKHQEGDLQVPEGVYRIAVFNPKSRFHLSLGLNYPNEADRSRVDSRKPGGDIYIHGSAVSIGCLAMGDQAIEQIFLLAYDVKDGGQRELPVHIFPARMTGEAWTALRAKHPQHAAFWSELQPVYDAFEKTKWVPRVQTTKAGRYELAVGDR